MQSTKKLFFYFLIFIYVDVLASDLGTTGLIDIPNARMLPDGELKLTQSSQKLANITSLTYQVTPWLESTLRYTIFNPANKNRNSGKPDGLNDRSYAVKLKLKDEGKYLPEVSVGIQDFLGTGALSAEYFVASKKIQKIDFTLGLGWGRLSERGYHDNPFKIIGNRYNDRSANNKTGGGNDRFETFFTGKVGLFGGVAFNIPKYDLTFNAEYNSDSFAREVRLGTINDSSPLSFGLLWSVNDNFDISLSRQQGNQWGILVSSKIDTKETKKKKMTLPYYSASESKGRSMMQDNLNQDLWYDRLFFDLDKSGIILKKAKVYNDTKQVDIEVTNFQYELTVDAVNRVLSLSEVHIPRYYKNLNLILSEGGFRAITISYRRNNRSFITNEFEEYRINLLKSRAIYNPTYTTKQEKFHTNVGANLDFRFQFFDPDKPLKHQVYLGLTSDTYIGLGWSVFGKYAIDLDNNFDTNRGPSSSLPNVRTDINRYLTEGKSGVMSLYLQKDSMFSDEFYYSIYGGLLEEMYAGLGAEVLYMPFRSRWAIGSTVNVVKKRDYSMKFDLLDYKTMTSFISLFYASNFYNLDFALHIGKYLAKDKGYTIETRRTFDNGFSIGAFATFTDVSQEEFGEGSFDKGLFLRIPFNSLFARNTKSSYSTTIRSIRRDGGQKVDNFTGRLWHQFRNVRYDSLQRNISRMIP